MGHYADNITLQIKISPIPEKVIIGFACWTLEFTAEFGWLTSTESRMIASYLMHHHY